MVTSKRKILTEEQKDELWYKRLAKLAGISLEKAKEIMSAKKDYKEEKISEMEERQWPQYSPKREKLISKMNRENPLRRIEDVEHAERILGAHRRHTETNYEEKLQEGQDLRAEGLIEDSKEYARKNFN